MYVNIPVAHFNVLRELLAFLERSPMDFHDLSLITQNHQDHPLELLSRLL